jgi:hypothetical protein
MRRMASWQEIEQAAPELVERARGYLDAHVHKTLATIRRDGAPRISGTEIFFAQGDVWLGSMPGALKARDLRRDARFALHSGSDDPPEWPGDAKLSGVVEEITDPEVVQRINGAAASGPSHLFRLDLHEASVVGLNEARDRIVIELWHPGEAVRRIERE